MQVNIPKPCSENWNEMSPTQRGAFCQKCSVDVIDFSNKSANEVTQTLKDNIGKQMCGRFKKSQLTDLSIAYSNWESQSVKTFRSKFLWACMIAFGMTLFTGCESSVAQNPIHQLEQIIEDSTKTISDTTNQATADSSFTQHIAPIEFIKGDIDISEPEMLMGEPAIEFEEMEIGKIAYIPECPEPDTNKVEEKPIIQPEHTYKKGKIAIPARFEEFLADTVKSENLPEVIETKNLKALVFPNPTVNHAQLSITPNQEGFYEIDLFDINGSKLNSIHNGILAARNQTFDLDLSLYSSGLYIIRITSENHSQSLKFNKVTD